MNSRHQHLLLCLTVLVAPAWAQVAHPADEVTPLPRMKVTAGDKASLLGRQLRAAAGRVPGGVAVVDPEGFVPGRGSRFEDWLRLVPGVSLSSDNAGDVSKISIRGSGIQSDEALGVQVLMDGMVYNQGDGEANLEEIDLGSVAAAEVFRGANSLRYGGYVLGGAINLVSATGRDRPGAALQAQAGSFGYRRAHASAGFVRGGADAFVALAARRTDGFRIHGAERAEILSGNFGHRLGAKTENRLHWALSEWHRAVPGDLTLDELESDPAQADEEALEGNFRVFTRSLRVADKITLVSGPRRIELGAFYHYRRFLLHDLYESDYRLGVTDATSDNLGFQATLEHTGTLFGWPQVFTAGLAPAHETERSENFRNDDGVIDRTRRMAAGLTRGLNFPVFAESSVAVTDRLAVIAGMQFVHIHRDFNDRFLADEDGDQSADQTFRSLNPRLGVVYGVAETGRFFANLVRSFQPPSFDDLNPFAEGENGSVVYTPLQAQRAWTLEAGHRGRRGRFEWDVALYHSRGRDELLELNDASGRDIGTVNAARTRHQGVELGLEIDLHGDPASGRRLTLRQEYTLNDFRFSRDPVYGRNRIGGLPVHNYEAELAWSGRTGFSAGATVQRSFGEHFADHANTLRVSPHTLLGLHAGYRSRGGFELFVEVANLTDRRYVSMVKPVGDARTVDDDELRIFAPGAPRSFTAGGSWSW